MYQSQLQFSQRVEGASGDALAAIGWSALAARLAAQRDLRHALNGAADGGRASFDVAAAAVLAAPAGGKRDVNRDALVAGKYPWANPADASPEVAAVDREY